MLGLLYLSVVRWSYWRMLFVALQ